MLSRSPAELFLLLLYAYNSASGGGPHGIRLTARQLHGLFNSSGSRVLLEFRRAGTAAAVQLAARLDDQERMDAVVMATTRIVAGMRAVGAPPDNNWILNDAERARLGDDEIMASVSG